MLSVHTALALTKGSQAGTVCCLHTVLVFSYISEYVPLNLPYARSLTRYSNAQTIARHVALLSCSADNTSQPCCTGGCMCGVDNVWAAILFKGLCRCILLTCSFPIPRLMSSASICKGDHYVLYILNAQNVPFSTGALLLCTIMSLFDA